MRAQRPLDIKGEQVSFSRELAYLMARETDAGATHCCATAWWAPGSAARSATASSPCAWRRRWHACRSSRRLESARPAYLTVARGVAALDPLPPLTWRGIAVFPDGIAAALAHASQTNQPGVVAILEDMLNQDVIAAWIAGRVPRADLTRMLQDVRDWRAWLGVKGIVGGVPRVLYGGNPLLCCASAVAGRPGRRAVGRPASCP